MGMKTDKIQSLPESPDLFPANTFSDGLLYEKGDELVSMLANDLEKFDIVKDGGRVIFYSSIYPKDRIVIITAHGSASSATSEMGINYPHRPSLSGKPFVRRVYPEFRHTLSVYWVHFIKETKEHIIAEFKRWLFTERLRGTV